MDGTRRNTILGIEKLIGKRFKVLDDGFIEVIDYMGGDEDIVNAARISFQKGTKQVSDDRTLIRYLMRNWHTSVFEQACIKLHMRLPIMVMRQIVRHRTAKINESSGRYSIMTDNMLETKSHEWRKQSTGNKQGSDGYLSNDMGIFLSGQEKDLQKKIKEVYNHRLEVGVAREQARKDMPVSNYTEIVFTMDLHNLLHFLRLRMDRHCQLETRLFANTIGYEIVSEWVPMTWEAFLDYRLNAMSLSAKDQKYLQMFITYGKIMDDDGFAERRYMQKIQEAMVNDMLLSFKEDGAAKRNRERSEILRKVNNILGTKYPETIFNQIRYI